jgi:peptidyl-prolyl cis-trans isomerase SurA
MIKVFFFLIFIFNTNNLYALQSNIVYKIENEIITNTDIKNEFNYLLAFNSQLKNLENEKIFSLATKSIIREKIKKTELLKSLKTLEIDEKYFQLILKKMYSNLDVETIDEFIDYLKIYRVDFEKVKEKIQIDVHWNQLIFNKYSSQIKIDIEKIKEEINNSKKLIIKNYLLSEIIYEVENKDEIYEKYNSIKKSIEEIGFNNTVLTYSISDSSNSSGSIGWVNERSLSKIIKESISNLKRYEISKPIKINGGVLILKIDDIKEDQVEMNPEKELQKIVNYQQTKQLQQFSKIYFNKVKKNLNINE